MRLNVYGIKPGTHSRNQEVISQNWPCNLHCISTIIRINLRLAQEKSEIIKPIISNPNKNILLKKVNYNFTDTDMILLS